MIAIIIGVLCILLVCQILKIILKTSIINKNKIDYVLEYIVFIIIFITIFMQEYISRETLLIIAVFGIIYEIISYIMPSNAIINKLFLDMLSCINNAISIVIKTIYSSA